MAYRHQGWVEITHVGNVEEEALGHIQGAKISGVSGDKRPYCVVR